MRYFRWMVAVIALVTAGIVQAGPFEEASDAYSKGDYAKALLGYRVLALKGDAYAQAILGNMYSNGKGVPKDDQQAYLWYRKAADQGHLIAQHNLGITYSNGEGVPKDDQQAYFWYLLASVNGDAISVLLRNRAEAKLTPQQRAAAQAQARDWKPRNQ